MMGYNKYKNLKITTKNDSIFIPKYRVFEAQEVLDIVPNFHVNKRMQYNEGKMIQAIKNGMIMLIRYTGEDDKGGGGERVLYPMNLGINKNTKNTLLRAWHVQGYSQSGGGSNKKVWRLFNVKNIEHMIFTGNFFRLPPKSYKMNDRVMTERTIQRADFNEIRRNQNKLIQTGKIEAEEETTMGKEITISKIDIKKTDQMIDLYNPWSSEIMEKTREQIGDDKLFKISIMKSILGNHWIFLIGAIGTINKSVKVFDGNELLGTYKTIESFTADEIDKHKRVKGKTSMDIYIFIEKKK